MKNAKIISIIALLALSFALLSGCGSDPIKDDITTYMKSLPAVQTTESNLKDKYNAVVGANATDNATLLSTLNDTVIPASNDALAAAKKIVPATKELAAVHDQYVTALTTENSGFVKFADVIKNDSGEAAAADAQALLKTAQTQTDAFNSALQSLAKAHGLDITFSK